MLTNDNYFSPESNRKYMSVSQFKAFEKCPACALAMLNGQYTPETTTALLVGSYVDAYFEGTLDTFKAHHPMLFKRDGTLKAEYVGADSILARVERDPLFMYYMSGKKQVILTGEIEDVPVKIKVDSLHEDKIVDLKCMRDFAPVYRAGQGRLHWVEAWGYDLQGAVYQEIVRQNTGRKLPFYLSAVTKEKEPDLAVIGVNQEYLDFQLAHFRKNVQRYDAMKQGLIEPERCEHCDYCRSTKVLTAPVSLEELIGEDGT